MALVELLTDLSKFKYTNYEKVGANNSPIGGRHGGYEGGGEPPHPEEHSKFDNGVGKSLSQIKGRHGGTEGPTPAQPPHPDDHSIHDDGVGFGVAPSDNPQSFNVRGYTVTGNKRFYIGWQGDIMNHSLSDYGIGAFDSIDGVFDHTQTRDKLRKAYENYDSIEFGVDGSVHVGDQDLAGVVGGGLSYYGSLVSIIPRGSIYRNSEGQYQVPQEGRNTNPPGGISGIPEFTGTQITLNIPQIVLTGPFGDEDYQSILNTVPRIPNAHGSDFMTTPIGDSVLPSNTVTHNVDMITLSGPTNLDVMNPYQTTLNTIPIATGAHGSDFQTTPIEAYSSIFATQDGLLMDTIYESGFNRGDMYITDHSHQSHPEFKEFSRTDTSLKRISLDSPNFDSDGNEFFTFKDRAPYNIPARDNTVFGFDQPFILKDIGDRWGPGNLGAVDEGLFRGGFVTSAARTVADVFRLGKFILTPKGIMFGLKQFGLQLLNPRAETRIWNPLSLGSVAPMVHVDRHWGSGTYEEAIDKDGWESDGFGSILDGYADAVISPVPSVGLLFTTGRRATLAHAVAMVPSRGGKMALPGIPELKWSDFPIGNIDSLSKNIVGTNRYRAEDSIGNKEYTISDGTPIIPARNPEAGFSGGLLASRYAGSQLTQMFLNEDGLFPSEALTDAVKKENVFQGQFILPGETSATEPGSYSSLFKVLEGPYKSLFGVTEQSIGEVVFVGKPGLIGGKPAVQPFLSYNVKVGSGIGPTISIYNPLIPEGERGALQGFNQGSGLVYDPLNKDYPAELQIGKPDIFQGNLYESDNTYSKGFVFHGTAEDGFKNLGLVESIFDDDIIRKTSQTDTVPGVAQLISFHNIGQGPTIESGNGLVAGVGRSVNYPFHDYIYGDGFDGDLYDKDKTYESQISSLITVSSPPGKTRLRTDTAGDPTVTIKTPHRDSNPNISRLSTEGKYSELEDIKLQDFPLINFTGEGNLGTERQSLGFVNKEITGLQGNLFGIPGKTRSGFGVLDNKKYTEIITIDGIVKGTLQGKDTDGIPKVEKDLAYEHKFAPEGISDKLYAAGEKFTPDFKTVKTPTNLGTDSSTKTVGFPTQTGNILDRYKTLAYGDIPKSGVDGERYGKKTVKTDKGGQYSGQEKDEVTLPNKPYEIPADDKLGLVKKNVGNTDYMYGHGTGIGEPDSVNMHPYGEEDNNDDFIKFKFKDLINNKYIIFRASLSGVSETLSPEWSSERYIGRPDSVHVYQGVERSMSFEFMVVPTSKQELPILWEKLNYLVGLTYPTWKKMGLGNRMEGPFMNLTIGDMYVDTPGFLSGLSITVDDQSPWELDPGFQLPHAISVSCEFTHIGKHPLASQGKHYDLGWLKNYKNEEEWTDGNSQLGQRGMLGPSSDSTGTLFKS